MTSMERIGALLTGKPLDRPPFTLTLSLYGARFAGCSCRVYYSDPEAYAKGQRGVVKFCSPDIVFSPFALPLEAAAYGAVLEFPEKGPPYLKKPAYKSSQAMTVPNPCNIDASPHLSYLVRAAEKVAADQKGTRPVAAPILAPTDLPILLLGMDTWLEMLLFKPDEAKPWVQFALDHFIKVAHAYATAGAAFLVTPVMLANPALVNPELAQKILIPLLRDAFSQLRIPIVFHHGGNRLGQNIRLFKELPNLAGFVIDERDSLSEARQEIGPEMLLLGNINGPFMLYRSLEDIKQRTDSILKDRKGDPKFIFASTGADIPLETEEEKLISILNTIAGSQGAY